MLPLQDRISSRCPFSSSLTWQPWHRTEPACEELWQSSPWLLEVLPVPPQFQQKVGSHFHITAELPLRRLAITPFQSPSLEQGLLCPWGLPLPGVEWPPLSPAQESMSHELPNWHLASLPSTVGEELCFP